MVNNDKGCAHSWQPPSAHCLRSLRCTLLDSSHVLYLWHCHWHTITDWQARLRRTPGSLCTVYMNTNTECSSMHQVRAPDAGAPPLSGTLLLLPSGSKTEHGKPLRTQEMCASSSEPLPCGLRALYRYLVPLEACGHRTIYAVRACVQHLWCWQRLANAVERSVCPYHSATAPVRA